MTNHCPHINVRGIYGDLINSVPGGRRNLCVDCGTYLDGPVSISRDRQMLIRLNKEVQEATNGK